MLRPSRWSSALLITSLSLVALGVVAAGVSIGQGGLGNDRGSASPLLSRPAAQVVVPVRTEPVFDVPSPLDLAPLAVATDTSPAPAPGPQSVPAPGPSGSDPAPAPAPAPTAPDTGGVVPIAPALPDPGTTAPAPDTAVDGVLSLLTPTVDTVLGTQEAGAEAPTSSLISLLGL